MADFSLSKKTISNLKKQIIHDNYDNFTKIANLKKQSINQFIITEIPSLIYNPNKCQSRVWNKGFGQQCSRCPKNGGKYCNLHYNELISKGYLKHGDIQDPPPKEFKKKAI
jgi:hypothetical protein